MGKNKFTPGPWMQPEDDKTFIYALNSAGYNRFWLKVSSALTEHEANLSELEANGNLISSAHELLEALEECVKLLEIKGVVCIKAKMIIDKAKGEA